MTLTPLQFFGLVALIVICLLAAVSNDIRLNRHRHDTWRRFNLAAANWTKLEEHQSKLRMDLKATDAILDAAVETASLTRATIAHHREDFLELDEQVHDARERITALESSELYRIFAERLRDGTFKRVKARVRKQVSPRTRRKR